MTEQKAKREISRGNFTINKTTPPKVHGMGIGKITSIFLFTSVENEIIAIADKLEQEPEVQAIGVTDRHGNAIGIITRKDMFGLLSRPYGRDVLRKKTAEILIKEVNRFNINDNIFTVSEEIEDSLDENTPSYYLLVNDKDKYCGIFSGKDMLVFLAEITRRDIALSKKIQTRIVKEEDDILRAGFSLSASSVMAKGIGGDFYSHKKISEDLYLIVLCDVSGKGMAASLLSSMLSGFINTYPIGTDIEGLVKDLNSQLTQSFAGEKFITGLFMIFNECTGQLVIADMGHTHYMLFRNGNQQVISNSQVNIPLGVAEDITVNTFNVLLQNNDCFFLMTDGMIEQKNEEGKLYNQSRIIKILKNHCSISPRVMRARLLSDYDKFRGTSARFDDTSFLILKYSPDKSSQSGQKSNDIKTSIEEKIKWSITTGKPLQIKTNRYLTEDRDFIDSVLDRFLNEAGIKFLMNKISYCVHELATNAKKANTKRVYFKLKELDINNSSHYKEGMKNFKNETLGDIDFYLEHQKKLGYFIVILFQLTEKAFRISVMNNSEMTEEELLKVNQKIKMAGKSTVIGEIYDQIEDYSEGAGLGIVMMSQMLKAMGLGPEVLTIGSAQGLTTSTIQISLRK